MLRTENALMSYEIEMLALAVEAAKVPLGYICAIQMRRDLLHGEVLHGQGTVHDALRRLEGWEMLKSVPEPLSERRRGRLQNRYKITPKGHKALDRQLKAFLRPKVWRSFRRWLKANSEL